MKISTHSEKFQFFHFLCGHFWTDFEKFWTWPNSFEYGGPIFDIIKSKFQNFHYTFANKTRLNLDLLIHAPIIFNLRLFLVFFLTLLIFCIPWILLGPSKRPNLCFISVRLPIKSCSCSMILKKKKFLWMSWYFIFASLFMSIKKIFFFNFWKKNGQISSKFF